MLVKYPQYAIKIPEAARSRARSTTFIWHANSCVVSKQIPLNSILFLYSIEYSIHFVYLLTYRVNISTYGACGRDKPCLVSLSSQKKGEACPFVHPKSFFFFFLKQRRRLHRARARQCVRERRIKILCACARERVCVCTRGGREGACEARNAGEVPCARARVFVLCVSEVWSADAVGWVRLSSRCAVRRFGVVRRRFERGREKEETHVVRNE